MGLCQKRVQLKAEPILAGCTCGASLPRVNKNINDRQIIVLIVKPTLMT